MNYWKKILRIFNDDDNGGGGGGVYMSNVKFTSTEIIRDYIMKWQNKARVAINA